MNRSEIVRMAQLESRHWWFVGTRRVIKTQIGRHVQPGARLLDVGCGTGYTLSLLQHDFDCYGLDFSPEATVFTTEKSDSATVRCSALEMPFAPGTFDAVTALDVVEHLDSDRDALAQIFSVLRPGGTLIATVPAHPWMFSKHDVALGHKRRYTARALRLRLQEAGFVVQRLTAFNCLLAPIIMALRLLKKPFTSRDENPTSDLVLPSPPVNRILTAILGLENWLLGRMNLPFGISLLAIAQKPEAAE